ncbi:MAG: hypothetical protein IJ354_06085 [Clostridia bacterium]|nr:hypothetical protein [Clostridia bacterium]
MWERKIHNLPTSFPHKKSRFPHLLRMWKTYSHGICPQKVFHNTTLFPIKTGTFSVENHVESVEIHMKKSSTSLWKECTFANCPQGGMWNIPQASQSFLAAGFPACTGLEEMMDDVYSVLLFIPF